MRTLSSIVALLGLSACATPAVQIKVPVMTVADAWRGAAGAPQAAEEGTVDARVSRSTDASPAPVPVLSAPDIRMAYIKPWTDAEGNRHFGTWVALQVRPARWVLPDGSLEAPDGPTMAQDAPGVRLPGAEGGPRSKVRP